MLYVEYQLPPPWRHRTMSLGAKPTTSSLQRRDSGYGIYISLLTALVTFCYTGLPVGQRTCSTSSP